MLDRSSLSLSRACAFVADPKFLKSTFKSWKLFLWQIWTGLAFCYVQPFLLIEKDETLSLWGTYRTLCHVATGLSRNIAHVLARQSLSSCGILWFQCARAHPCPLFLLQWCPTRLQVHSCDLTLENQSKPTQSHPSNFLETSLMSAKGSIARRQRLPVSESRRLGEGRNAHQRSNAAENSYSISMWRLDAVPSTVFGKRQFEGIPVYYPCLEMHKVGPAISIDRRNSHSSGVCQP